MICVSAMYANAASKRFDHDYYARKHMPMVLNLLKDAGMSRYEIDRGLSGAEAGSPPVYLCIGRLYFETAAGLEQALAKHGPQIMADLPNYTDAELVLQVGETT